MIDTDTLRKVALGYDIVFGKAGNPKPTRRGDMVRAAADEIEQLRAEVTRLRKAIDDAPHDSTCRAVRPFKTVDGKPLCDCWKHNALEAK